MVNTDVFVSFRGVDIRRTFLSHLLSSFKKNYIITFTSSESSPVALQALQDSLVAIPVFSKDHTSLDLWVQDVAKIIEYEKKRTLTAVPIFFQLDPLEISNMLRKAGKKVESMRGIQRKNLVAVKNWLEGHVTNKTGFHSYDCKDDSELVGKVTSFVLDILSSSTSSYQPSSDLSSDRSYQPSSDLSSDRSYQYSAVLSSARSHQPSSDLSSDRSYQSSAVARSLKLAHALRSEPFVKSDEPSFWRLRDNDKTRRSLCVEDLCTLLLRTESVLTGICGIQGVGKTSIARHVYGEISSQFQHHCFIKNMIRPQDISYRPASLLNDLACEALKGSTSFHGRSNDAIKEMIRHRKVLLVVDDVDDVKQLEGIIKDMRLFGPGSRIIVTTQDKSLFTQCGVKQIYELECPKFEEALTFFSEFAFKQKKPLPGFESLSFCAVQVSNRLPLSLKILGSFLRDKEKDEWVSTLRKLEASHNNYATEVCRYVGADGYAQRRPMKVEQHVGVDEANRFPFYSFALK